MPQSEGLTLSSAIKRVGLITLPCGCVVTCLRELGSSVMRDRVFFKQKGANCRFLAHRAGHSMYTDRIVRIIRPEFRGSILDL